MRKCTLKTYWKWFKSINSHSIDLNGYESATVSSQVGIQFQQMRFNFLWMIKNIIEFKWKNTAHQLFSILSTNFNFVEKKNDFVFFRSSFFNCMKQNDVLFILPSQSMIVQLKMDKNGIKKSYNSTALQCLIAFKVLVLRRKLDFMTCVRFVLFSNLALFVQDMQYHYLIAMKLPKAFAFENM